MSAHALHAHKHPAFANPAMQVLDKPALAQDLQPPGDKPVAIATPRLRLSKRLGQRPQWIPNFVQQPGLVGRQQEQDFRVERVDGHSSALDRRNPVIASAVVVHGLGLKVTLSRRVPRLPAAAFDALGGVADVALLGDEDDADAAVEAVREWHASGPCLCGLGEQRSQRLRDLFDRLHTRLRHVATSYASDGVVVDAGTVGNQPPVTAPLVRVERCEHVIEFHSADYADAPSYRQAHPHKADRHDLQMEEKPGRRKAAPPASTLMSNLGLLIGKRPVNAWALERNLPQSSVARVLSGQTQPTTGQLEKIALAAGVEPWQLLAPDLGANLYRLTGGKQFIPAYVIHTDEGGRARIDEHQPASTSADDTPASVSNKVIQEWSSGYQEKAKSSRSAAPGRVGRKS